ncbi:serine/threonine protein kinase [Gloeothece citriformis PCC 7424]|uniref:non-specific serine/threonine protein kinase n=1 Tax=Gloeothece citriformis (strain PCC 7424) TaxID=65393 RepID=B7KKJ7_GLOC7|nr:serine/threonine-protein kinase [Gloeothece citriformis]ACK72330.1 serine/threonine protein kinase [Gloeothece citriformis PCC 7424]
MDRSQYRILGLIGQGQFGRVFCAIDRQTGELVALKELELTRFPTHKFLREFSYLLTLRHPHIVACTGIEYHQTGRYLVMDYCEGGTLRDLINFHRQLSLGQKLKLIENILSGLAHAHSYNIVHCDVKPENILLTIKPGTWQAKISDFGIARLREEMSNSPTGGYTGSPAYMAPERFYGKHSFASDLYAVGIILFELLVGKRPFSGYPGELMTAHLSKVVNIPETLPPALHSILEIALRKLPQRRFKSAKEMLKAVHLAGQSLAVNYSSVRVFLASSSPQISPKFKLINQFPLPQKINHLAVGGDILYLGMEDKLYYQPFSQSNLSLDSCSLKLVHLDGILIKLYPHSQGFLTLTKSPLSQLYQLGYFFNKSSLEHQSNQIDLPHLKNLSSLAFSENWLTLATSELSLNETHFHFLKLPSLTLIKTLKSSLIDRTISELVILNNRHGLAIYADSQENQTLFQLFTRRGSLGLTFSLATYLHSITSNPYFPYLLFAIEARNSMLGVLITLKPLKVIRVPLQFKPDFIIGQTWGFLLANRRGKVSLLTEKGQMLESFEVDGGISAIASRSEFKVLIATSSKPQPLLNLIDLEMCFSKKINSQTNLTSLTSSTSSIV